MKRCLVSLLLVALAHPVSGGALLLEKVDLFEANTGGYALYRIPGILVTQRGTVLAYCEARRTGKSDWDAIDILLRRSSDGGRTWSRPSKIADVPGQLKRNPVIVSYKSASVDDITYNNPVAIADRDGTVHFLFCLEYMRCFYLRSEDDGVTWSKPVEITRAFEMFRPEYDWKVLATGPAHGIQLRNGRLIVPVWLSTSSDGGNGHRPSVTSTIFSDDGGRTWKRGEIAVPHTTEWINPSESVAAELAEGGVMLNVRSESKAHRRLVTRSKDGATGWSKPRFDSSLLEPICMASLVRLSTRAGGDRNRLLFANPDNLSRADGKEEAGKARDRKNLSLKLSYDEGESWPINKLIEAGPGAYSDLAVTKEGVILCFYERRSAGANTARLTLARCNLEWLTEGNDALSPSPNR